MKTLLIFVGLLLTLAFPSFAACSGSGLTWSCTAGSTAANVQSAVNSASDGATITLANGSYSLSGGVSLNNRNGISIVCATVGGCTITATGNIFTNDFCSGNKTNLIRISGFQFTGAAGTAKVWIYCDSNITQLRIDNNTFTIGASEIAVILGESSSTGKVYGVMDHNLCTATNNFMCLKNISGGIGSSAWVAGQQGGANAFFFESNTCSFTNNADLGTGCVDAWRANSTVVRFNVMTNSRIVNHSYCHEGPYNSETYRNTISAPNSIAPNYRNIHLQGSGEAIIWGNTVEVNGGGDTVVVQHFRSDSSTATSEGSCNSLCNGSVTGTGADSAHANDGNRSGQGGYPCWHQPGRDVNATLKPLYSFMNATAGGTKVNLIPNGGGALTSQVASDRDYYNAVSATAQTSATSPFDGTTGVGYGTLANRPTTCTATPQAADAGNGGVGYWATDQGEWDSTHSGADGQLYRCSATNTWTLSYTPYTYPHPLQGSASAPTVSTTTASSITASAASSGGNVTSDGGASVTARGVCRSASANPTTSDTCTSDGTGTGTFTSSLSGMSGGTTYHYRAFATNSAGTAYGSDLTLTTDSAPTVTTTTASSITTTAASSGGNVTSDGGDAVTSRGVCYGASANPTTPCTSDGTGTGSFSSSLTGLTPGATYHYRAFATNGVGTAYGSDLTFTTSAVTAVRTAKSGKTVRSGKILK